MDEILYRLKKDMPGHPTGDLVIMNDMNIWTFEREPYHKLDQHMLDDKTFFEKIFTNWKKGEKIYYIGVYFSVVEEEFHPARHSRLIECKNAFKDKDVAEEYANKVKDLFYKDTKDEVVISKQEVLELFSKVEDGDYIAIKNILNKLII